MRVKLFKCANGHLYKCPENSCVFCIHCTDIFYDYSHGPYMAFCDLDKDESSEYNYFENCKHFEEDPECDTTIYVEED